jgi:hypothetical protein
VASRRDAPLLAPADKGKGLVVNARHFHAMIRAAFDRYLADLRSTDPTLQTLQSNFSKKMDNVCKVPLASELSD